MNEHKDSKSILFENYPDILTVNQTRNALGIGRKGVYKLLESNSICYFKIGNAYKIPKSSLIDFIKQGCKNNIGGAEL